MTDIPRKLNIATAIARFPEMRRQLDIFVDGERMSRVLSYDIDEGTVVVAATGPDGIVLLNEDSSGVETRIVRGKVAVQRRETAHAPH